MQTFMPASDFTRCAVLLDDKRLGKQRVECKQILNALTDPTYGWQHHPAVNMWRGCEPALVRYAIAVTLQWRQRGFNDSLLDEFMSHPVGTVGPQPWWVGKPALHRSHQSNLVRKDPQFYRPLFPRVPADLPYYWPT